MNDCERDLLARLARGDTVVLDGAMGTMLRCHGSAPPQVRRIHEAYVHAGADVILTNTFRPDGERRIRAATALAREAAGERVLVAGDIGPGGDYRARARWLIEAGVDLLAIETMTDIDDACSAVEAAKRVAGTRPVVAMLVFDARGRTPACTTPREAARALEAAGADIVGANCSLGPHPMEAVIAEMRASAGVPIAAKPSAGLPAPVNGRLTYPVDELEFARWAVRLRAAGATLVGGCCGTTPAHMAAVVRHLRFSDPRSSANQWPVTIDAPSR